MLHCYLNQEDLVEEGKEEEKKEKPSNMFVLITVKNRHVLHKNANEDVPMGFWFIGLDVDDRRLCCSKPPGIPDAFVLVCLAY